ncbi:hypothetical protein EV360DRAFT_69470 [Lentinula raphanica]|nr:hypothetical protein EV360DRAFT_69470 [Lentinula raphanica]
MPAQRTSRRKTDRSSDDSVSPSTPSSSRKRGKNQQVRPSLETAPTAVCGESGSGNPTASQLLLHSHQTTEDWYKSSNTKKGYAGYVKSGKKWILEWAANTEMDSEDSGQSAADTEGLAHGFDSISKYTPMALRLLTAYKCDHQGNKFSTAEGIRSAFKDYFERVLGCQGEFWKFNSHSHEWEGNPVFETDYRTYYESLKNRENRTSTFTQALPMLPADLKILFAYLDSSSGCREFTLTQCLYFKAFASAAFNLWTRTRNDELIHFMVKDLKLGLVSETGVPYIEFRLIFRKTNKDPNKVQAYHIPPDLSHPEFDCYTHMTAWIDHLRTLLQRPLLNTDYVFPGIASTGQLKFGENTSRMGVENLLESIVEASGLMEGRSGKFTTHCFRRGGAQYRFMWADHKWSLKAVKWWGGWSSNENVGTIMRYLLDELMAYEEGFTDIMMPDSSPARHESFMGSSNNMAEPISRQDILSLEYRMTAKFENIAKSWSVTPPATPHGCRVLHSAAMTQADTNLIPATPTMQGPPPNGVQRPSTTPNSVRRPGTPPQASSQPSPSRIPEVHSLDDVVRYWEEGDIRRGLVTPLKDWKKLFDPKEYKSEAVKLSNIRFVYEEFAGQHGGSYDSFETAFPDLRFQYTKLLLAIRKARKARGEAKSRRR